MPPNLHLQSSPPHPLFTAHPQPWPQHITHTSSRRAQPSQASDGLRNISFVDLLGWGSLPSLKYLMGTF